MKASIMAGTSYSGIELLRLLNQHPEVEIAEITGNRSAGKDIDQIFPHLESMGLTLQKELHDTVDIVFSALPRGTSAVELAPLIKAGNRVIDIGTDFRLKNPKEYRAWYGSEHPFPQYLNQASYGLTELNRSEIKQAQLVANPGCYPTAAILAMAPAIKAGIIEPDIIIDAKSGVSGAGQKLAPEYMYSEANENIKAYSLNGHYHLPEMTQELNSLGSTNTDITFVPHVVPMTRGILATCYSTLKKPGRAAEPLTRSIAANPRDQIQALYKNFYKGENFVRVVDSPPSTKQAMGSNICLIHPTVDLRTNRLIVVSAIDNLVKGASGQAVQNMNVMFDLPETYGLRDIAIYP